MMQSGMAMMFKALGVEPEVVMKTLHTTAEALKQASETLSRVEAKLDRVIALSASNVIDAGEAKENGES
jgi:hypothetical protein